MKLQHNTIQDPRGFHLSPCGRGRSNAAGEGSINNAHPTIEKLRTHSGSFWAAPLNGLNNFFIPLTRPFGSTSPTRGEVKDDFRPSPTRGEVKREWYHPPFTKREVKFLHFPWGVS